MPDWRAFAERHGLSSKAIAELEILSLASRTIGSRDTLDPGRTLDGGGSEWHEGRPVELAGYPKEGPLGSGGMGEVQRVLDPVLGRTMAMKIQHNWTSEGSAGQAKFIEEAQVTAQLHHPGVVAVHELGQLGDGRMFFTMTEVKGKTLREVYLAVHQASTGGTWEPSSDGWSLRRLTTAFHQVCQTMAYAHSQGVVHRDLKPENIMLGAFGEVLVLDWGLAKVRGRAEAGPSGVTSDRSSLDAFETRAGSVLGTPVYMSPEQANGELEIVDERSDVYSLGAILYELLAGQPPFGGTVVQVLGQVLSGKRPKPIVERGGPAAPPELIAICLRAMSPRREDRFEDAASLATSVASFLDGEMRRESALGVVAQAEAMGPEAERLRERSEDLLQRASSALKELTLDAPEGAYEEAWRLEDEGRELALQAELSRSDVEATLQAALTHAPDLLEAHATLTELHLAAHRRSEEAGDELERRAAEKRLERQMNQLPPQHAIRLRASRYLAGQGRLTLLTEPAGAEVRLQKYETGSRRLHLGVARNIGFTPLIDLPLDMGSYLLELRHPAAEPVRYPVLVGRGESWHGLGPGESASRSVHLPPKGSLEPNDCYVPAGWFQWAGDPEVLEPLPVQERWCDGFVMSRFAVTNQQFIDFLDDLERRGDSDLAQRYAPRALSGEQGESGPPLFDRRPQGRYKLRPDAAGQGWKLNSPVVWVDWFGASAYTSWYAEKSRKPWRLPTEFEWEKAARGVDGRRFAMGNFLHLNWCRMGSRKARSEGPAAVDSFPIDVSPYGVRGMTGNVVDWCSNLFDPEGGEPVLPDPATMDPATWIMAKGGAWIFQQDACRAARRRGSVASFRFQGLGFRLVRSI